jgi:hypothetical protein
MPRILTHLQRDVIAYILAANEDQEPPENSATHFMQAFEGGFSSTIPFTLFMPSVNRVILYVAEAGANDSADRRSEFSRRCEVLKKPLVQIANFIIELVDHNYLHVITRHDKIELHRIMVRTGGATRRFMGRRLTRYALCVPRGLCQNGNCIGLKSRE